MCAPLEYEEVARVYSSLKSGISSVSIDYDAISFKQVQCLKIYKREQYYLFPNVKEPKRTTKIIMEVLQCFLLSVKYTK